MGMPIRAKVLNVLGERSVVINAGKKKGVTLDMVFEIFALASQGANRQIVKGRVRVVEVYDKMALTERCEPLQKEINDGDDVLQII